jgi:hypothetical protein
VRWGLGGISTDSRSQATASSVYRFMLVHLVRLSDQLNVHFQYLQAQSHVCRKEGPFQTPVTEHNQPKPRSKSSVQVKCKE